MQCLTLNSQPLFVKPVTFFLPLSSQYCYFFYIILVFSERVIFVYNQYDVKGS